MAYKINEDCISCGACEPECPNGAIKEGDTTFIIDPKKCTECVGSNPSPKCAETCPVGAPVPDPVNKETREQLLKKWQTLHPGQTPKV
jgi:ferredoxin